METKLMKWKKHENSLGLYDICGYSLIFEHLKT